jgi:hypothetical protein
MSSVYCVRCRSKTPTVGGHVVSSGGRKRMVGKCARCGTKKSQFMKGGGVKLPGYGVKLPGYGVKLPGYGVKLSGYGVKLPGYGVGRRGRRGAGVFDDVMNGIERGANIAATVAPSLIQAYRGRGMRRRRGKGFLGDVMRKGVSLAKEGLSMAKREAINQAISHAPGLIDRLAEEGSKRVKSPYGDALIRIAQAQAKHHLQKYQH